MRVPRDDVRHGTRGPDPRRPRRRPPLALARLAIALTVAIVVATSCGDADDGATTAPPTTTNVSSPTTPITTSPATPTSEPTPGPPTAPTTRPIPPPSGPVLPIVDWANPSLYRAEVDGWTVAGCGEAPILCVEREAGSGSGSGSGSVEAITFPADSFDVIARPLADGDIAGALEALVADYHASIGPDREQTCPPELTYAPLPTTPATVGGTAGLRYGFEVRDGAGTVVERSVSYSTLDTEQLVIISAAALDPDQGCLEPIGEFAVDDLLAFEPILEALVANSRLPSP